jgi:hypothetical protein
MSSTMARASRNSFAPIEIREPRRATTPTENALSA